MIRGGSRRKFATVFSSRACPLRCSYCHNSYGRSVRERSADSVLAEIDLLVAKHGVREIVFLDDIFNHKPQRAKDIAHGLIERRYNLRLSFPNGLRGDQLDEELVDLLQAAGMVRCSITVDSAVPASTAPLKEEPKTRQGAPHRRVHGVSRCEGARSVHARIPQRDRG